MGMTDESFGLAQWIRDMELPPEPEPERERFTLEELLEEDTWRAAFSRTQERTEG